MSNEDFQVYTPAEAVKYLKEVRGIIFTVDGLRNRRRRKQAHAKHVLTSNTLWTKAELDAIQPSKRTKRVPNFDQVKKNENGGEGTSFSSVI